VSPPAEPAAAAPRQPANTHFQSRHDHRLFGAAFGLGPGTDEARPTRATAPAASRLRAWWKAFRARRAP
jgi:hypothetical protein